MPEDMPDKMPEGMSDRMPEDLPVTKCINVMVGITRSKVIFYTVIIPFSSIYIPPISNKMPCFIPANHSNIYQMFSKFPETPIYMYEQGLYSPGGIITWIYILHGYIHG